MKGTAQTENESTLYISNVGRHKHLRAHTLELRETAQAGGKIKQLKSAGLHKLGRSGKITRIQRQGTLGSHINGETNDRD